jgi:hypothetical protein
MNNYIKNTNEDEFYQIWSHSTWHIMADMICHKFYELLMSILRIFTDLHANLTL